MRDITEFFVNPTRSAAARAVNTDTAELGDIVAGWFAQGKDTSFDAEEVLRVASVDEIFDSPLARGAAIHPIGAYAGGVATVPAFPQMVHTINRGVGLYDSNLHLAKRPR